MPVHLSTIELPRPPFLGGRAWKLANLQMVTVLLGKNGCGKSMLLRKWRDSESGNIHYIAPERTGEMNYQPQYMTEEMTGATRGNYAQTNWVPDYRSRVLSRIQVYLMTRGNTRAKLAPPGDPDEVEGLLSTLIPDFSIRIGTGNPPYVLSRSHNNEAVRQIRELSSGEAQLLTIGLDLLTVAALWEIECQQRRIVLLDEPDAHIHPDMQSRFADFLIQVARRFQLQLVIATHSTTLLAALAEFGREETGVIYLGRDREEYRAIPFQRAQREAAACLGGHLLMGPLFGAPLLLVEGDDDYRIWSQVPRHHVTNLAVVPCSGSEIRRYQLNLEQILGALRDETAHPAGFALIDGDARLPAPEPENPQRHIRFIRLGCREAENLYLCDEVLQQIGTTWPDAIKKLREPPAAVGEKAARLRELASTDRRDVDLKGLMLELQEILDPKALPWTQRVGTTIGRSSPSGQLRDFLGNEVMAALWPGTGGATSG